LLLLLFILLLKVSNEHIEQVLRGMEEEELHLKNIVQQSRGGSSPKILGGIAPSAPSSPSPFLRSSKPKKYELYIGLHLKSIIMVANSVMGYITPETCRNEALAGVGFLGGEQQAPCPSARGSKGAL